MGKRFRLVAFLAKAMSAAVIFASALYSMFVVGPKIETAFFAPVSKLQILSMIDNGDGTTTIEAAFRKLRECEYIGIAWYRGTQAAEFERVPIILARKDGDTSSPNRPVGYQRSGPWIVSVPIDEVKTNSFAQLFHRCHPFWVTTTEFYP